MKIFSILPTAGFISALASGEVQANPGQHLHPHLSASLHPYLHIHPAIGVLGGLAFWLACVWVIESIGAVRQHNA